MRVRQPAATTPVKAPTLMKPAWPSDSSPDTPTTRFSDTASDTYAQMGTSWPDSELEMKPMPSSTVTAKNATITMA